MLDIEGIGDKVRAEIRTAIDAKDLPALLSRYDNKGLFAQAAQHLRNTKAKSFESWLTRVLISHKTPAVVEAIKSVLPPVEAR